MRLYGDAASSVLTEIAILCRRFWLFFYSAKINKDGACSAKASNAAGVR